MAASNGGGARVRSDSSVNPFNDASVAATATVPVPDMPRRRGNTAQAAQPEPVMYLSAQGSNSVEQAAHSFLATADVPLPDLAEKNPPQLAAEARWEAVLAAVPAQQHHAATAEEYKAVFVRTSALLALNRMKAAVVQLDDALGEEAPPDAAPLPLPLLLLRAYCADASAATEGQQQECTALGEVVATCWSVVDGGPCPPAVGARARAAAADLDAPAALAWGCKGVCLCSSLWMQAHQDACADMAAGGSVPHAAALQYAAAAALLSALRRVWDAQHGRLLQAWQGPHALSALSCAVAIAGSLVRVYLHCGQLQAAVGAQQLLAQLERAVGPATQQGTEEPNTALKLIRAVVLSCDATVSLAQGNAALALAEAEEGDTAAVAAGSQAPSDRGGSACRLADGPQLHAMAQNAVRSSCSCLCMVGSVLAGQAWAGLRAGNQLIASNAPAHMGSSRAICSNITTMYDLTSTKTDAQFAREVLTHVASKYQLAQVLQGGWIKTI